MSKESVRERARRRAAELGDSKFWKMAVGDNVVRILPTPKGKHSDDQFEEFAVHEKVGKDKKWLRCGIHPVTEKGKCWLCQVIIPKLRKKGKDERAVALEPKQKMAVQIAIVDERDGSMRGPKTWLPSTNVQKGLVAKIFDSKKKDYTHPKKGYNLTYKRVGTGMNDTQYFGPEIDDEPSKVSSKIMDKLKPFDELKEIPQYSEKAQKQAYLGIGDDASSSASSSSAAEVEEDIDLEDEDRQRKKRAKKSKSKKASSDESSSEASSEDGSDEESSESESESSSSEAGSDDEGSDESSSSEEGSDESSSEDESSEESSEDESSEEEKSKGHHRRSRK